MAIINFSKMHGLGNDFMVIDGVTQSVFLNEKLIKKWADRHRGIGFDQLLLIEPPYNPKVDFHYRIFNADGSEVEQCGNGARCLARFVYEKKLTSKKHLVVSTMKGEMELIVGNKADQQVSVFFPAPEFEPKKIGFRAQKREKTYLLRTDQETFLANAVSMGNPHCVLFVDDVSTYDVAGVGLQLSRHERFVQGVNVGFCQIKAPDHICLRVYERGVGETQACGTGACAAAVLGMMFHKLEREVQVSLTGGQLTIQWDGEGQLVKMTGEAIFVFDGRVQF